MTATPFAAMTTAPPPEVWQNVLAAWQSWCASHRDAVRLVRRLTAVTAWLSVLLAILAALLIPRFGSGLVAVLGYAVGAAFTAAEDFVRRVTAQVGLWAALFPDQN